jgi:hypothetical protein
VEETKHLSEILLLSSYSCPSNAEAPIELLLLPQYLQVALKAGWLGVWLERVTARDKIKRRSSIS